MLLYKSNDDNILKRVTGQIKINNIWVDCTFNIKLKQYFEISTNLL